MMESIAEDLEKSSVADSSTTYPQNGARTETISGSDLDELGSRNPKTFSVVYSENAGESRVVFSGGSDVEFDMFQNGEKEMLRRYLQDTAHYTDTSGILASNQEMFEHFLFSNACDHSFVGDCDMRDNFEAMDEEEDPCCMKNYIGHEVGVSKDLTKAMDLDEEFNSSDSFASTESIIPKKVACPKCPKKFMFKSDLKRHDKYKHLRIVDSYFCKYCKKAFAMKEYLKSHEQIHKKRFKLSGKYQCEYCNKAYSNSGNLSYHLKRCPHFQASK